MFSEYKQRTAMSGQYEGECPMVPYIDMNDLYDETTGDVTSPMGWTGRAGRWLLFQGSQGFIWGNKFPTLGDAKQTFSQVDDEYLAWLSLERPD